MGTRTRLGRNWGRTGPNESRAPACPSAHWASLLAGRERQDRGAQFAHDGDPRAASGVEPAE
jgi:hypothetical protein